MNVPKKSISSGKKLSFSAKLGVILGVFFSFLGTAAGFYFGVLRPALSSGQGMPLQSLWGGIVLVAILALVGGIWLWRWIRDAEPPPADQDGDVW